MGLGSGMMFPQLLPLYWRRFNGVGYTVGMIAGVVTALVQRFFGSSLGPDWAFLNEERWLLPIIGLVGLVASVVGSLVSAPTPEPVLRHFYNRTLPFGFWSPVSRAAAAGAATPRRRRASPRDRRAAAGAAVSNRWRF